MSAVTIPKPGEWIRTDHHCWWDNPTSGHPATLHNAPVKVERVVKLTSHFATWRVEATRCDGSGLHLLLDADGRESLSPTQRRNPYRADYAIVPAPEAVSA